MDRIPNVLDGMLITSPGGAAANLDFVMEWTTTTSPQTVTLPATSASNNFEIDWGDTNSETVTSASPTHEFTTAGTYTITITGGGTLPIWSFNNGGDKTVINDITNWGSIGLTDLTGGFRGCTGLTVITATDVGSFGSVTGMAQMFAGCTGLTTLDVSGWDTSLVNSLASMFSLATSIDALTGIGGLDVSSVTTSASMFKNCFALTSIDLSGWNPSALSAMNSMFDNCTIIETVDVSFDVSGVTNTSYMFRACAGLTGLDLSSWDASSIGNMRSMFENCTILNVDVSGFDITSITNATSLMSGTAFSQTNYDLLLVAWEGQVEPTGITFHAGTATYGAGAPATARGVLAGASTWTITDGGAA